MALRDAASSILAAVPESMRHVVKPEFHACCIEISTGICDDVAEVRRDLLGTLQLVQDVADRFGICLVSGGTHPFSHWYHQPITAEPRYHELAERFRETLCRQLTFGLHVHVGVPSGDSAVRVCQRIQEDLPVLLALSSNSPFWCGRATGLQAHRIEVLSSTPLSGLPPQLESWEEYSELVSRLIALGVIQSQKDLWWDVRPSPANGTVEIRICDMPADLDTVLALTALMQCLVCEQDREDTPILPPSELLNLVARQNRWLAARHGMEAELIDPRTGTARPVRQLLRERVDALRDVAVQRGCQAEMAHVRELAEAPSGAQRQLATYQRSGRLLEVLRRMPILGPRPAARGYQTLPGTSLVPRSECSLINTFPTLFPGH